MGAAVDNHPEDIFWGILELFFVPWPVEFQLSASVLFHRKDCNSEMLVSWLVVWNMFPYIGNVIVPNHQPVSFPAGREPAEKLVKEMNPIQALEARWQAGNAVY